VKIEIERGSEKVIEVKKKKEPKERRRQIGRKFSQININDIIIYK